jgi:hypothetical protein
MKLLMIKFIWAHPPKGRPYAFVSKQKEIEITEYKLIAKQIYGINIFESSNENEKIELIAERPIKD